MADIPFTSSARSPVGFDNSALARAGLSSIRWGAVVAGVVAAVGIQCLLTVLGIALGLSSVSADTEPTGGQVAGISAAAAGWWLLSGCAALTLGGMIVGWTAGLVRGHSLHLNAFIMWALSAVFGFIVLWSGATTASSAAMYAIATSDNIAPGNREVTGSGIDLRSPSTSVIRSADTPAVTREQVEQARRLARTASWWSVFGLVAGCAASIAGAWVAAPQFGVLRRAEI